MQHEYYFILKYLYVVSRDQYLQAISYVLRGIKQENATAETNAPFSIKQDRSLKVAIELIVSIGIIPCLLPGVGAGMARLCPRALKISQEECLGCLEVICFARELFRNIVAMILLDDCSLEFFT